MQQVVHFPLLIDFGIWVCNKMLIKMILYFYSYIYISSYLTIFSYSFGYFNPRYEKNRTVAYSILAVVIYYIQ